jgi:phage terminase small subunit
MLNERQEKFCDMYVADPNATKAAINSGYGRTYAGQTAYKLLQDPRIQRRIEEKRANLRSHTEITPERLVEQYRRIALTNPTDLMIDNGDGNYRFKRPDELTDDEKTLIQNATIHTKTIKSANGEQEVVQSFEYKLATRKEALDSLARINGMFRDKVEHEHRHKIDAMFEFIAKHPEQNETVAMLNARHGRGATIEGKGGEKNLSEMAEV